MGQSLSQIYVHLTFGVKGRLPLISKKHSTDLHKYIHGILRNLESPALIINSVPDHIHILFRLSKNHALVNIVQEIKKASSKWMKTDGSKNQSFTWQIGYGAFSVSSSKVEVIRRYIKNQKKHHQKMTYKQELERFMKEYDVIEYKPEYFWR